MSFLQAIEECKFTAQHENRVVYVYQNEQGKFFWGAPIIFRKWLFKAYPGGRTEMSTEGTKVLQSKSLPNTRLHSDDAIVCPNCGCSAFYPICTKCGNPIMRTAGKA